MSLFTYIWEYIVKADSLAAFKSAYGSEGAWVQLFRKHPGYIRTELYQDESQPQRFITIDYWESKTAFEDFKKRFEAQYQAMDEQYEALTQRESFIGNFQLNPSAGERHNV